MIVLLLNNNANFTKIDVHLEMPCILCILGSAQIFIKNNTYFAPKSQFSAYSNQYKHVYNDNNYKEQSITSIVVYNECADFSVLKHY